MPSTAPAKAAFDLKSTAWTLTALRLHSADAALLARAFDERFADSPGLFDDDPVVLDLSPLREADPALDYAALLPLIRRHRLQPVAVQGGSAAQTAAARAAGLAEAMDAALPEPPRPIPAPPPPEVEVREIVKEVVREAPAAAVPTLVVDKPLRSGQRVYARGSDLVVMAIVSFGAEVIADGHIHVYAPLRGRAIAGARGDAAARIFSTCMEPQLVSIAGIYRTTEVPLSEAVWGKPAQVRLDGERILVDPIAH